MKRPSTNRRIQLCLLPAALCLGMSGALAQTAAIVAPATVTTVTIVTPKSFGADPDFANGCWVKLYDGIAYAGEQLTLIGPIDLPHMTRTGSPWRDWDSAVVGPKARVTVYDAEDFKQVSATLNPRQRIPDMSLAGFGMFHDIKSVRLNCSST